jgi:hypothetical protein
MLRRTLQVANLLCTALAVTTAAVAQPPSFVRRPPIPANHAPRAIAAADVSGDGWTDIILGGTNPGTVTVLKSMGIEEGDDGERFTPLNEIPVGGGPFDLVVGDLNRDGRPDIAVANADSNAVTLLFGIGRGDFAPPVDLPVADNPRGIALGDFNRDGALDIIVTKFMGSTLDILYGAGDGTFPTRRSFAAPTIAQGVAVADFNHDGWLDAVVASANGTVSIYSMSASGATRQDLHPSSDGWNVVTTGDFDRDGRPDVALASTAASVVEILYNTSSGWTHSAAVPVAASPRGIAAGDLNRDGRLELAVAGRSAGAVTVISRGSDGALTTADVAAGAGARAVAIADFEKTGGPGIATANEFDNSSTELLSPSGIPAAFAFERKVVPERGDNRVFGVGDFNENGTPDIVRQTEVLLDGTTPSRHLTSPGGQSGVDAGAVGDFNGDGHLDVVYAFLDGFRVFFGNGAGGFADGPMTLTHGAFRLRQADINRDGRADIVALTTDGTGGNGAEVWLGQGNGTFVKSTRLDGPWNALEVGDVDRNGALDVVTSSAVPGQDGVFVFPGDGRGGVKSPKIFGAGTPRFGFDLGDVNDDGCLDLAVADGQVLSFGVTWSPRFTIARGVCDGTFVTPVQYDTTDPGGVFRVIYSVRIGDLNGDSHADIFTSHADLFIGSGLWAPFGEPQRFAGESFVDHMLVDVNGDGLLDALGYNTFEGFEFAEVIMLNTTRQQNRPPAGLALPDRIVWPYERTWADTDENELDAGPVRDPDMHAIQYRWVLADGTVVSTTPTWAPPLAPGTYQVTVTASDGRGGSISDTFTLDVPPFKETVLLAAEDVFALHGAWQFVNDPTASHGIRVWHPNANAPKQTEPLANPVNYFDLGFLADPTQEYKLWIRMKAEGDNWANDSVFVQFTGAKDAAGNPIYQIGTTSALAVNLEECSNCGVSGWGWEDDGWGAVNRNGVTLHFPAGGPQTIRIQTREDGVSIDQIVLSSEKYKTTRPGTAKDDTVKLDHMGPFLGPSAPR